MPDTETIAAPSVEGVPAAPGSQDTTPAPQGDAPLQETEQPKVEGQDNKPQATETPRPKPSEYYRERERVRRLEESHKAQSQQLQEMAALLQKLKPPEATDVQAKFDWEEFLKNPENVLSAREKRYLDQIQKLEGKISNWENSQSQTAQANNEREALEILFPKAGPDDKSKWEERVMANPERGKQLIEILRETKAPDGEISLAELSRTMPKLAVRLALEEFESQTKPGPTVLKKSVMGGTARGGPGMGKTPQSAMDGKRSELKRLNEDEDAHPELRFDEKHRERKVKLISEIEKLAQE